MRVIDFQGIYMLVSLLLLTTSNSRKDGSRTRDEKREASSTGSTIIFESNESIAPAESSGLIFSSSTTMASHYVASDLSYATEAFDRSGAIMSHEQKREMRGKLGYCMTCPGVPVLLFDVKRSRLNPLWTTKQPLTVDGQCRNGHCLKCEEANVVPAMAVAVPRLRDHNLEVSFHSAGALSSGDSSVISLDDDFSLSSTNNNSVSLLLATGNSTRSLRSTRSNASDGPTRRVPPLRSISSHERLRSSGDRRGGRRPPTRALSNLSIDSQRSQRMTRAQEETASAANVMQEIRSLLSVLIEGENYEEICDVLLGPMSANKASEDIQVMCLEELVKIFDKGEAAFLDANGHSIVLAAMLHHKSSALIHRLGCELLGFFSSDPIDIRSLQRAGVCVSVVQTTIVKHVRVQDTMRAAISLLRHMTHDPDIRESLRDMDAYAYLVAVLRSHVNDIIVQCDGVALLSNVALDSDNEMTSVPKDVLEAVVSTMFTHMHRGPDVIKSACFALKNFSFHKDNLRFLMEIEGVNDILDQAGEVCEDALFIAEQLLVLSVEDESMQEHAYSRLSQLVLTTLPGKDLLEQALEILDIAVSERLILEVLRLVRSKLEDDPKTIAEVIDDPGIDALFARVGSVKDGLEVKDEVLALMQLLHAHEAPGVASRQVSNESDKSSTSVASN